MHEDILTKNSRYFRKELNRLRGGSKNKTIALHDVNPDHFAGYLQVLQKAVYIPDFKLRAHQDPYPLVKLLHLWELAFRFGDRNSMFIVEESLDTHWEAMTVEGWNSSYLSMSDDSLKAQVLRLQEEYKICKSDKFLFKDEVVEACGNCPPQVFAEVFAGLELGAEFRAEFTKSFALRHADPKLTKKKKSAKELLPMTPAKRLKSTQH